MLVLDEYTRNTSGIRVGLVILTPPIVTTALVLCQESIPLQDPMDGWKANYGFWARVGIIGVSASYLAVNQLGVWIGGFALSTRQLLVMCCCVGAIFTCAGMATAEIWAFPVPFFMYTLEIALMATMISTSRAVLGAQAFREMFSRRGAPTTE